MNRKGIVLPVFLMWVTVATVVGGTAANKSAQLRLTENCVWAGGTYETCKADVKKLSFRNKMLALQK